MKLTKCTVENFAKSSGRLTTVPGFTNSLIYAFGGGFMHLVVV